MAQDDNTPWDSLPSVILLEIFSYLPHFSRLQASQVCFIFFSLFLRLLQLILLYTITFLVYVLVFMYL